MISQTSTSSPLPFTESDAIDRDDLRSSGESMSTVARVVMICIALATPAMRAARFTVSPKTSLFSSITGPAWKPARIARFTLDTAGSSVILICMSVAARQPLSASGSTHITSSPMVLTTRPPYCATMPRIRAMHSSTICLARVSPRVS